MTRFARAENIARFAASGSTTAAARAIGVERIPTELCLT